MPWIILGVVLLILIFALLTVAIVTDIKRNKAFKSFKQNNPDFVRMRIFTGSSDSLYRIRIFSISGVNFSFNMLGSVLYLVPGKARIIAQFVAESKDERAMPIVASVLGGVPELAIKSAYLLKKDRKKKAAFENPKNGITIDIEFKKNGEYEMKADPYEDCIKIICFEGEKHAIKLFK